MQLHPRESFTITRQLNNPYITDTFYVRAVIRNAKTDSILDTVDLTDKTGQRFTKVWTVPADVSGQGFWISIITSVYTDSGYTTKSENYGDEENTYLVQDRYNPNIHLGASGGPDIDYKRIQKMIDDAVNSIPKPEPKVEIVTKEIVKEVKIPEVRIVESFKETDLSGVIREIRNVGKKVDDKEVTEIPEVEEVDFTPILEAIKNIDTTNEVNSICKKMDNLKIEFKINSSPEEKPTPGVDGRINRLMKIK